MGQGQPPGGEGPAGGDQDLEQGQVGRPLVVAGIWCVIAGVALLCLLLPLRRKEPHAQP